MQKLTDEGSRFNKFKRLIQCSNVPQSLVYQGFAALLRQSVGAVGPAAL